MKKAKLSKEELSKIRSIAGSKTSPKKAAAVRRNLIRANAVKTKIFKFYKDSNASD